MDISTDILQSFVDKCCNLISDVQGYDVQSKMIFVKKHKIKMSTNGEFSFCNLNFIENSNNSIDMIMQKLMEASKEWTLPVVKVKSSNGVPILFLDRQIAYMALINIVLKKGYNYGRCPLNSEVVVLTTHSSSKDLDFKSKLPISDLRLLLVKQASNNLLSAIGYEVIDGKSGDDSFLNAIELHLSSSVNLSNILDVSSSVRKLQCEPVLNTNENVKECTIMSTDYFKLRQHDMKVMSAHKYGNEVQLESGWNELLSNLAEATVKMDLLCIKPSHTVAIDFNPDYVRIRQSSSKGATFVMYNCARISKILAQYDTRVAEGYYPSMIPIDDVDFSLLSREDEWELLYNFILKYPSVIRESLDKFEQGSIRPDIIINFLLEMSSKFSTYYRRTRILIESRSHLFPLMFARLYLLKAIEQVLHNALGLLDIVPLSEM